MRVCQLLSCPEVVLFELYADDAACCLSCLSYVVVLPNPSHSCHSRVWYQFMHTPITHPPTHAPPRSSDGMIATRAAWDQTRAAWASLSDRERSHYAEVALSHAPLSSLVSAPMSRGIDVDPEEAISGGEVIPHPFAHAPTRDFNNCLPFLSRPGPSSQPLSPECLADFLRDECGTLKSMALRWSSWVGAAVSSTASPPKVKPFPSPCESSCACRRSPHKD